MFQQDPAELSAEIRRLAGMMMDTAGRRRIPRPERQPDPAMLAQALEQLGQVLERSATGTSQALGGDELTRLGDYGLSLLGDLAAWNDALQLPAPPVDRATVSFALWLSERGGTLSRLEPVVNALARIANGTHDTDLLQELSTHMGKILEAVHPAIRQDLDNSDPSRPWRVLNLNRAIVATRSHAVDTMDAAFQVLIRHLPQEAPAFFREGMRQMDLLNYPPQVREVMQRYFQQWSARTLH